MVSLSDLDPASTQLRDALVSGLETLDLDQQITFQAYTRVVLPLDGYIFWSPTTQLVIAGSLHIAQEIAQNEDETYGAATVVFTAEAPVTQFIAAPINTIYVATVNGTQFAFSQQQGFYQQAGIWHYFGHSIPPALSTQLLSSPNQIDPNQAVVSNSLPLWLALNKYGPATLIQVPVLDSSGQPVLDSSGNVITTPSVVYPDLFNCNVTLYPSFVVSPNLVPPYGVVHIGEEDTRALQSAPYIDVNRNHWQLGSDRVRITLYGLQNNAALDFLDCVEQYSVNTGNFGIMNMPIVRDAKRTQSELQAIAMKKYIDFEVSYYQFRAQQIARTLIEAVQITFIFPQSSVQTGGITDSSGDTITDSSGNPVTDSGASIVTDSFGDYVVDSSGDLVTSL